MSTMETHCGTRQRLTPRAWAFVLLPLAVAVGCGDSTTVPPPGTGGTGGTGATTGSGGSSGAGGMAGGGGMAGMGGAAGTGGSAGTGGTGGAVGACVTSALCHTCPNDTDALPNFPVCDTNGDCFPGFVCVPSGCETHGGAPIGQCQNPSGGSCDSIADCPDPTNYRCDPVAGGPKQCLRDTAGCLPSTESYDCAPGFFCNADGECEDHRAPCDTTSDCPKSHVCHAGIATGSFCLGVYQTCHDDDDCRWAGVRLGDCDNVDADVGNTQECSGQLVGSDAACVNTMCSGSTPVCENGVFGTGTTAVCGDYGLCRTDTDCPSGFDCIGVGQDGRKECVESPGDCESATDCPPQQVCAAPRDGGSPSCQAGKEAM
jgi:hypothetical protein